MPSSLHERDTASRIVWVALGLALLGDLVLLRKTPWGLNAVLWLSLLSLAALPFAGSQAGREAPRWPLLLAVACAAGLAWRASPLLLALFAAAYLVSISLPLLHDPWKAGVLKYPLALGVTIADVALFALGAVYDLVRGRQPGERRMPKHAGLVRGALAALPFLLIFGALFSAADPVFEWYVGDVFDFILERLPSHLILTVFLVWIGIGFLYGLAVAHVPDAPGFGSAARRHGTEALVVLALVDALFLLFLLVQVRVLFGGRELVQATLGLSYAEYARQGFFQLVAAASIALPGLLAADWLVPEGSASRSRFRGLAAALLVMMIAVLVSAALRMRLYVDAYGLTELRAYTSAFMVWLAFVFVWFGCTVLRGRRERFMAGALGAFILGVFVLSAVNPDAVIVRANMARAADRVQGPAEEPSRPEFDARYAVSLSDDAVPVMLAGLARIDPWQRCVVAERLLDRESENSFDWRTWNLSRRRSGAAIDGAASTLRDAFRECRARLSAPAIVVAGSEFPVQWTGFRHPTDHVSIARPGAPEDEYVSLSATRRRPLELKAPAVPGRYEIRYHLGKSRRVVGRLPLVVGAPPGEEDSAHGQALRFRRVADRLDVVPVGIEHEGHHGFPSSQAAASPTRIWPSATTIPKAPPPQRESIASWSPGRASSIRWHGRVSPRIRIRQSPILRTRSRLSSRSRPLTMRLARRADGSTEAPSSSISRSQVPRAMIVT